MGKKTTIILDDQVFAKAKELVEKGFYKSMNSFIETAIKDQIVINQKMNLKRAIMEASNDPLFLSDIMEVEKDFSHSDFETGRE